MRYQSSLQPQFNSSEDSSSTKSFRFSRPNYTQTPNDYYDHVMPSLKTVGEHAVMQAIIRQTIGWGNKEWDRISLSQLMKKTGLSRPTIRKAIRTLCDKELIIMHVQGRNGEQETFFKLNIEDSEFVSDNDEFSNNCDRERFFPGRGKDSFPTKETNTKETKNKVVGNRAVRASQAPPPPPVFQKKSKPVFQQMSKEQEAQLIEMAGKKQAQRYAANAAKTLTSERFKDSPLRSLSHFDLAVKYFREDTAEREKESSVSTKEATDNKSWLKEFSKKAGLPKEDLLFSKTYCVIFPTQTGEGPKFYYIDQNFRRLVQERVALSGRDAGDMTNE